MYHVLSDSGKPISQAKSSIKSRYCTFSQWPLFQMEYAFGFRQNRHNWIVNARKPEFKALSGKDTAIKQRFLVAISAISTQVASVFLLDSVSKLAQTLIDSGGLGLWISFVLFARIIFINRRKRLSVIKLAISRPQIWFTKNHTSKLHTTCIKKQFFTFEPLNRFSRGLFHSIGGILKVS